MKIWQAAVLAGVLVAAGCKSSHVEVTVENRTGAPVRFSTVTST